MGLLIKRVTDVVLAALGLMALFPLLMLIAVLVRVKMGCPVFFRQVRPGYHGKPFTVLKFRTMRDSCGLDGKPLPDADRLTPLGKFLRRTSMDELPELWNVLKGDMSLVGPRPLLMEYLPRYTQRQDRRHEMRPGITGWTQCTFKGKDRTWEEKLESDVWYIEHWSLWLDLNILIATFGALRRRRHTSDGITTREEFMGSSANMERRGADGDE